MVDLVKREKSEIQTTGEQPTPMQIIQSAISSGMVVADMKALFDLQERHEKKEAEKAFIRALNEFKSNPPKIVKDLQVSFPSKGGKTEYKHADLAQVSSAIGKGLMEHGISHRWRTSQLEGGFIRVTCIITHSEGHSEETTLQASPDASGGKNPIQAIGSTVTYLERYTLLAATGIAVQGEDDDALQGAMKKVIDQEQLAQIQALIDETGSSVEQFCKASSINSLSELTNDKFGAAISMLNRKKNK